MERQIYTSSYENGQLPENYGHFSQVQRNLLAALPYSSSMPLLERAKKVDMLHGSMTNPKE
eukprot:15343177-Ditylum_brightwellii.AAC.1